MRESHAAQPCVYLSVAFTSSYADTELANRDNHWVPESDYKGSRS